jgi:hypothetical protein
VMVGSNLSLLCSRTLAAMGDGLLGRAKHGLLLMVWV